MDIINSRPECNSGARRYYRQVSAHQRAVHTIGARLVAYRINGRPEQLEEILGMARMALTLGAIDPATHTELLRLLYPLDDPHPGTTPNHTNASTASMAEEVH
ncbi:hypothetical protein [Chromohalobacter sp. HP20-39]|uniref:hypothetical protein n=1 Tax=Chromohalobacter sp. HP20-39 TaxID=3079306 RepID=UPI00294AC7A5|nr:hypothetical protein [Chromohalobacter sp. HP20-39]MDV6319593.1 hypothetical protein [Chromohalobacter sp. HP20-39]